jgi:phosphoglycolate phosphatase
LQENKLEYRKYLHVTINAYLEGNVKKVGAILFDLDGVLIDSFRDVADTLNFVLSSYGMKQKPYEDIKQIFGYGLSHLLSESVGKNNGNVLDESRKLFTRKYQELCLNNTPHVAEVLDFYKDKNMAVVTNKPEHFAKHILEKLNVGVYFKYILGPESVTHNKPHPEVINKLLAVFRTDKRNTVIVGDSVVDINAGKAAGIITCYATYGFGNPREIIKAQPDYSIDCITGLRQIFN